MYLVQRDIGPLSPVFKTLIYLKPKGVNILHYLSIQSK